MTETTISANYGDFLLSAVEKAKDQFSDEEYKTLTADAEKIRAIEEQIAALAPAEDAASSAAAQGTAFPKFEGSDLEGNPVDNRLFAGNTFTVVNLLVQRLQALRGGVGRPERPEREGQGTGR